MVFVRPGAEGLGRVNANGLRIRKRTAGCRPERSEGPRAGRPACRDGEGTPPQVLRAAQDDISSHSGLSLSRE